MTPSQSSFHKAVCLLDREPKRGQGFGAKRAFKRAQRAMHLSDSDWLVLLVQLLELGSGGAASSHANAASYSGLSKPALAASSFNQVCKPEREIGCPSETHSSTYLPTVLPINGTAAAAIPAALLA